MLLYILDPSNGEATMKIAQQKYLHLNFNAGLVNSK